MYWEKDVKREIVENYGKQSRVVPKMKNRDPIDSLCSFPNVVVQDKK